MPKRVRSAIAPAMSPQVMNAKRPWKIAKGVTGMPPDSPVTSGSRSAKPRCWKGLPKRPPTTSSPKAIEYPTRTQTTATTARAPKTIMIMFRTLLERTMPP